MSSGQKEWAIEQEEIASNPAVAELNLEHHDSLRLIRALRYVAPAGQMEVIKYCDSLLADRDAAMAKAKRELVGRLEQLTHEFRPRT
jgi:hypothetical protein